MSGVYVHIPFCRKACSYCDFHFSTSLKQKGQLVEALVSEINLRAAEVPKSLKTLYFGGGTPSLLELDELERIMEALKEKVDLNDLTEITLEANPEDVTPEKLAGWKRLGFDRMSIGTQSFFAQDLLFMNRDHSPLQAETSVKRAQDAGFEKITIDLIYGIPAQSLNQWQENVGRALALNTGHLSSYCLTIEPRTALHKALEMGTFEEKEDAHIEAEYLFLHASMEEAGLEHYEISNFAKKGHRALHNSNYWSGQPYLGLGPSAHSFDGHSKRNWNIPNNARYIKAYGNDQLLQESEVLTVTERCNEILMTSLRTVEGFAFAELEVKDSREWLSEFQENLRSLSPEMRSWISTSDRSIQMNPDHWLKCDALLRELIV